MTPGEKDSSAYDLVIEAVFFKQWRKGLAEVPFSKDDLMDAAKMLGLRIKNPSDILYTYRSRKQLPSRLLQEGHWVISARGAGSYAFVRVDREPIIEIPSQLKAYPVPYAVPEIVAANIAADEQGVLTIVRYNRLLDIFTELACFHIQSHMRTQVPGHGQVEVDDLYLGLDKDGRGFVVPIEAKASAGTLGLDKAVNLSLFARFKYPKLVCRPVAVVRETLTTFALVEFEAAINISQVEIREMRRYTLVEDVARKAVRGRKKNVSAK